MDILLAISLCIAVLLLIGIYIYVINPFPLWFQAFLSGAGVKYSEIVSMKFRRVNTSTIVINKIRLKKADDSWVQTKDLEECLIAGGNVGRVVSAYITGKSEGIALSWAALVKHDLEGDDILLMVNDALTTDDLSSIVPLLEDPID